jgi:hypothetical protein
VLLALLELVRVQKMWQAGVTGKQAADAPRHVSPQPTAAVVRSQPHMAVKQSC